MNQSTRKEVPAYICSHVFNKERAVLLVSHEDGDWQFLCGGDHDPDEKPRVVGLNHMTENDPTLLEIMDLPIDWEAERKSPRDSWVRSKVS